MGERNWYQKSHEVFFDGMISFKNLDPNNIKIDKKSYKNILIYDTDYVTSNSVKPLDLIINEINRSIEERMGTSIWH